MNSEDSNSAYLPSLFWRAWGDKNVKQLDQHGLENFKQTVGTNYFTWTLGNPFSSHFRSVAALTRARDWPAILAAPGTFTPSKHLKGMAKLLFPIFTRMLWLYAKSRDRENLLNLLSEPTVGNPFGVYYDGRLISQELAYSLLEYYSVREHFAPAYHAPITVAEIGAGAGRVAHLWMSLFPRAKYFIIDIPPTIFVSQYYLSRVFPRLKIFKIRDFSCYTQVEKEMEAADIVFLLPHQIERLPARSIDLCLNISSFQEMRLETVRAYLKQINRIGRGFFYMKQWKRSVNRHDNLVLDREDYPVPPHWYQLYDRTCPEMKLFFERLYRL